MATNLNFESLFWLRIMIDQRLAESENSSSSSDRDRSHDESGGFPASAWISLGSDRSETGSLESWGCWRDHPYHFPTAINDMLNEAYEFHTILVPTDDDPRRHPTRTVLVEWCRRASWSYQHTSRSGDWSRSSWSDSRYDQSIRQASRQDFLNGARPKLLSSAWLKVQSKIRSCF